MCRDRSQYRFWWRDDHLPDRVKGHLDQRRPAWFDGLTVMHTANGVTILAGPVEDQAALHGRLIKVHDLHLPLIAGNRVESELGDNGVRSGDG